MGHFIQAIVVPNILWIFVLLKWKIPIYFSHMVYYNLNSDHPLQGNKFLVLKYQNKKWHNEIEEKTNCGTIMQYDRTKPLSPKTWAMVRLFIINIEFKLQCMVQQICEGLNNIWTMILKQKNQQRNTCSTPHFINWHLSITTIHRNLSITTNGEKMHIYMNLVGKWRFLVRNFGQMTTKILRWPTIMICLYVFLLWVANRWL